MNKGIRIIFASLLLLGILILARDHIAWAGHASVVNNVAGQGQVRSVVKDIYAQDPGSVQPPPADLVIPVTGTYSVGGVCTLQVEVTDKVVLNAVLLAFDVLDNKPENTTRYLAGVCEITFTVSGQTVTALAPENGNVKICFAALPNIKSAIYVHDYKTWTALDTTLEENNSLECATASKAGRYVLAENNP